MPIINAKHAVGDDVYTIEIHWDYSDDYCRQKWQHNGPRHIWKITLTPRVFYHIGEGRYPEKDVFKTEKAAATEATRRHNKELKARMR